MTIVEFLLARIAEDEARAQARREAMLNVAERWPTLSEDIRNLIDVRGIDRVLAECQAKRAIIEQVSDIEWTGSYAVRDVVLGHLAAVYADHPDYDEAWRP